MRPVTVLLWHTKASSCGCISIRFLLTASFASPQCLASGQEEAPIVATLNVGPGFSKLHHKDIEKYKAGQLECGSDDHSRVENVIAAFKASGAHIVALQELPSAETPIALAKLLRTKFPQQAWCAEEAIQTGGCVSLRLGFVWREPFSLLPDTLQRLRISPIGQAVQELLRDAVAAQFQWDDGEAALGIVNVHLDPCNKYAEVKKLRRVLEAYEKQSVYVTDTLVLTGDFNLRMCSDFDAIFRVCAALLDA